VTACRIDIIAAVVEPVGLNAYWSASVKDISSGGVRSAG